jgi:hypothetical protein
MSARKDVAAALRPLVPKKWAILDADRNIDETTEIALLVSQRTIEPAPNAAGNHRATLRVYVIDPHEDPDAAEDALDDAVELVCFALDTIDALYWTTAEKVIYQGRRAYQITVQAFTVRKD